MGSFTPVSHLNISGQDMTLTVKRKQIPGNNTAANFYTWVISHALCMQEKEKLWFSKTFHERKSEVDV